MATKLLSDVELRAHFASSVGRRITIEPGTILTPAAKDFIREQGIEVSEPDLSPFKEATQPVVDKKCSRYGEYWNRTLEWLDVTRHSR